MDRYPRFGPGAAKALQSSGLADNRGNLVGPVLSLAVVCDDMATLDVCCATMPT